MAGRPADGGLGPPHLATTKSAEMDPLAIGDRQVGRQRLPEGEQRQARCYLTLTIRGSFSTTTRDIPSLIDLELYRGLPTFRRTIRPVWPRYPIGWVECPFGGPSRATVGDSYLCRREVLKEHCRTTRCRR